MARSPGSTEKPLIERIGNRKAWNRELNQYAPPGVNAGEHNTIGDAYRHYMTAGQVATEYGEIPAVAAGDFLEFTSKNEPAEHEMDRHNNRAGAATGKRTRSMELRALDFMNDVIKGQVVVQDATTKEFRRTGIQDLRTMRDDGPIEDRYMPHSRIERYDVTREKETIVA